MVSWKQGDLFTDDEAVAPAVVQVFEPARLTQARVLQGMTKRDLAATVGVSPAAIGQYEAEVTTPRPDTLAQIARVLRQDVAFFSQGRPFQRVDSGSAYFRSLRSLRAADRDLALVTAEQIWELTCALERYVQLPTADLPDVDPGAGPRQAARLLREHWELPACPVGHLVALMEAHGVIVVLAEETGHIDRVDAFSTVVADRPIVMSTPRRSNSVFRHRFTCAHELGHLVLHHDRQSGDALLEREADEFAAEFLTPAAEMSSLLPERMDFAALHRLSQTWGVSMESLVRRMGELRMVSDVTIRRAYVRLNALRAVETQESVYSYAGEVPRLLRDAVELAATVGVDVHQLARDLWWRVNRVRELLGMEDPRPVLRLLT